MPDIHHATYRYLMPVQWHFFAVASGSVIPSLQFSYQLLLDDVRGVHVTQVLQKGSSHDKGKGHAFGRQSLPQVRKPGIKEDTGPKCDRRRMPGVQISVRGVNSR